MKAKLLMIGSIGLVAGCYSYRHTEPADAVAPAAGTRIQVRLTQQGAITLAQQIGSQAVTVDGDVVSAAPDTLKLAVRSVEDAKHVSVTWKGEEVAIPRDAIASVGERRLAIGPTALIGGLAAGTVIAAAELFSGPGESTAQPAPPPQGHQ